MSFGLLGFSLVAVPPLGEGKTLLPARQENFAQHTLHARSTHVFSDEEKKKIAPCGKCCVQLLLHGTVAAEKKRTAESSNHREKESPPHKKNHPAETWNVEEVVGFFAQLGYESAEAATKLRQRTRRPRGAGPPTEEDH